MTRSRGAIDVDDPPETEGFNEVTDADDERHAMESGFVILVAAACGLPQLPKQPDGPSQDEEPPSIGIELLASDIGGPGNVDGMGAAARFDLPAGTAVDRELLAFD